MPELAVFPNVQVDIGIAAHITFFKVTVSYLYIAQDFLNSLHKECSFFRRCHIRLSYNFYKRSTTTVVVNIRVRTLKVKRLTNVLFKVDSFYANTAIFSIDNTVIAFEVLFAALSSTRLFILWIVSKRKVNITICTKWNIILSNLISLSKVRIKIMFAVKFCIARNVTIQSLSCNCTKLYIALRNARHGTRKSQTNRTNTSVRHSAVSIFAGTKSLSLSQKLCMNFATNYNFPLINHR